MRKVSEEERQQIVNDVMGEFRCFGRGAKDADPNNPLTEWNKEQDPHFALGVKVRDVVDYVISRL